MFQSLISSLQSLFRWLILGLTAFIVSANLSADWQVTHTTYQRLRPYTYAIEFDFVSWTLQAVGGKLQQASLDEQHYLSDEQRSAIVRQYFGLQRELDDVGRQIETEYARAADPAAATAELRAQQAELRRQMNELQPLAEAIVQEQVATVLNEHGLTLGGQPFPPVAYRFTPLPLALIISPRNTIKHEVSVMLVGDVPLDQQVELENRIHDEQNLSAFITPVGGIGTYPTMVMQSSNLNWIADVVSHEWAHNYLGLRPLGLNLDTGYGLWTMNETTASLFGNDIGAEVIRRYYPDSVPPPEPFRNTLNHAQADTPPPPNQPPSFDFRAEMHTTRVRADELLKEGKIDEAETYLEERRQFFVQNGYVIRKLNQAYFAFYGSYAADSGGGASGIDPVGPAVRLLRRRSSSVEDFINTMAWFSTYEQLQNYLAVQSTLR